MASGDVFFVQTGGNDTNDGFDNIGVGLATATWTESTLTLVQAGHGYTFAAGDVIYISGGTGATVDLYEVASSTVNNIVLVGTSTLPDVGNGDDFAAGDLATGDITSSTGPWVTIDKAMNTVAAGNHVYVRGGTSYTETATIDTVGTTTLGIEFRGYTTDLDDDGSATIDGESSRASGVADSTSSSTYYVFKNFICENCTGDGWEIEHSRSKFVNCQGNNNGAHGFDTLSTQSFYNCTASGNTLNGFDGASSCLFFRCTAHGNSRVGINMSSSSVAYQCLVYDGPDSASYPCIDSNSNPTYVLECAVDGENQASAIGISQDVSGGHHVCINSIAYDCNIGFRGIAQPGVQALYHTIYNGSFSNGTDYSNWGTPTTGDVISATDPFNDSASRDYTLDSAGAAVDAGHDFAGASPGMAMGIHQAAGAGGGSQGISQGLQTIEAGISA